VELFHAARELAPEERDAFLRRACGGDEAQCRQVQSLLYSHDKSSSFMETPISSRPDLSEARPIPEHIGGYRIVRLIGAGGMGVVYEAEQQSPRRAVALKVIRGGPFADQQWQRLFQREVQSLARLKHPAIAAIYEAVRPMMASISSRWNSSRAGRSMSMWLDRARRNWMQSSQCIRAPVPGCCATGWSYFVAFATASTMRTSAA